MIRQDLPEAVSVIQAEETRFDTEYLFGQRHDASVARRVDGAQRLDACHHSQQLVAAGWRPIGMIDENPPERVTVSQFLAKMVVDLVGPIIAEVRGWKMCCARPKRWVAETPEKLIGKVYNGQPLPQMEVGALLCTLNVYAFARLKSQAVPHRFLTVVASALVLSFLASPLPAKKKKKPDDEGMNLEVSTKKKKKGDEDLTQTLPPPRDAPAAVSGSTNRLIFQTSPLSAKGLLSQQTRDALHSLLRSTRGLPIIKLRAFVAGSGDMRRVQEILGEVFGEKRLALPALSVVQVGALPLEGAQVIIEAIAEEKKATNPNGLAFVSGQAAASVEQSIVKVESALRAGGMQRTDTLRVTCFLSSIEESHSARVAMESTFPGAATNYVQMQREPVTPLAECEAVARVRSPASTEVSFLNPPGLDSSPNYSQVVLVTAPRLVFTSTQLGFGRQEGDVKLAFERLQRALTGVNARFDSLAMSHVYLTSGGMAERIRTVRATFYNSAKPPASTLLPFEGLPSLDASFGVDVVAVPDTTMAKISR